MHESYEDEVASAAVYWRVPKSDEWRQSRSRSLGRYDVATNWHESTPALQEVAKLLGSAPSLKLWVVGHTDGVGAIDANMRLSQARAEAVVAALTTTYKIAPARLKGYGVGPLAPVASNAAEESRAKNRRVELVQQ